MTTMPKSLDEKKRFTPKPYSVKQALLWNDKLKVNEYTQRRLTFGRYINVMIRDIPLDYLKWGIVNLNNEWAEMFARELQRRQPEFRK